jgi:UDP-N-acetylmuramyl pentapeptide phosphotransferase/UDP-N-acetylglucosamine-1-phosphate transferase
MLISSEIMFFILFLGSLIGSFYLYPKVIQLANSKRLTAEFNNRSSHIVRTPNIGGLVFFIAMVFGVYLTREFDISDIGYSLIVGMVVLLFVGLKDDLMVIGPRTKSFFQLLAIMLILINPGFHVQSFHGFLGIYEIPLLIGIPFSAFVMLSIINAYNFIDGIDGLAGIVGIIILGFLGFLFYTMELYLYTAMSFVVSGSILAFLRFNLSKNQKIFMGDTGSMLLGFFIGSAVIRLFSLDPQYLVDLPIAIENIHLLSLAVLIVPFFDSIRVTWIRLSEGKSFFQADRNHIHHILIDHFRFTHLQASLLIGGGNLIFTSIFFYLSLELSSFALLMILAIGFGLLVFIFLPSNFKLKKANRNKQFTLTVDDFNFKKANNF